MKKKVTKVIIETVGIFLNIDKAESKNLAKGCIEFLIDAGFKIALLEDQLAYNHPKVKHYVERYFFEEVDCIVVLGGDGTLLSVARRCCFNETPLFGINLGKLGFLTEGESSNFKEALQALAEGAYYIEERMMLSCLIKKRGYYDHQYIALNDVLIKSRGFRMIEICACANGHPIDTIRADGLIISTPTGSTGYSLAAGGPVVAPKTKAMILNPICPHRLHDRAYILPDDEVITLKFGEQEKRLVVTLDGQTVLSISPEDQIIIEKAAYITRLICLNNISYFDRIRLKMFGNITV